MPTPAPTSTGPSSTDIFKPIIHGIGNAVSLMPIWVVLLLGAFLAVSMAAGIREMYWKAVPRDPIRRFSSVDRAVILWRAGLQCEHHAGSGRRCRDTENLHADHVHPHSRGGTSTVGNGQALCSRHNKQKAAHIPFNFQLRGIQKRRAAYFPEGESARIIRREPSSTRSSA